MVEVANPVLTPSSLMVTHLTCATKLSTFLMFLGLLPLKLVLACLSLSTMRTCPALNSLIHLCMLVSHRVCGYSLKGSLDLMKCPAHFDTKENINPLLQLKWQLCYPLHVACTDNTSKWLSGIDVKCDSCIWPRQKVTDQATWTCPECKAPVGLNHENTQNWFHPRSECACGGHRFPTGSENFSQVQNSDIQFPWCCGGWMGHIGFFLKADQFFHVVIGGVGQVHTGFFLRVAQLFHDVVTPPPSQVMETEVCTDRQTDGYRLLQSLSCD